MKLSEVLLVVALAGCSVGTTTPDAGPPCELGEMACDGTILLACTENGLETIDTCPDACDPSEGCVACVPGSHRCDGQRSLICSPERTWTLVRNCRDWDSECGEDGFCEDECAEPERTHDNVGCEYYAAALPSLGVNVDAIVVANPSDETAHVTILDWDGPADFEVPPRSASPLPVLLYAFDWSRIERIDESPGNTPFARIRSDIPVIATQAGRFREETMVPGFHGSASLLTPTHGWGRRYYVVAHGAASAVVSADGPLSQQTSIPWRGRGSIAIVGSPTETTHVAITPAAPIQREVEGAFGSLAAGERHVLTLRPGESAHLLAAHHPYCSRERPGWREGERMCFEDNEDHCFRVGFCDEPDFDLTGTLVESDRPIAVFAGIDHAHLPFDHFGDDHFEEQLPPVETWGREHISASIDEGGIGGENLLRIVARDDGTEILLEPPQDGVDSRTLEAGEWIEVRVSGIFRVLGSRPILVAQFLLGTGVLIGKSPNSRPWEDYPPGGPSMWIVPPAEQYRRDYPVSVPRITPGLDSRQYFLVARPAGATIAIDEVAIPAGEPIGNWEVNVVPGTTEMLRVRGDQPFALIGIGMSPGNSYASAQGRGLVPLIF